MSSCLQLCFSKKKNIYIYIGPLKLHLINFIKTEIACNISLTNWVSYRLQVLFWFPDNQNEFYEHTNVQPHCGEFGSTIFLFA
jgi:hypothetical protein